MAPDDSPDKPDEPRAKDLLTRPREELEERMDPETLARLASWFDQPSLDAVDDGEVVTDALSAEEQAREERRRTIEAACAAADPKFIRHIERHERSSFATRETFTLKSFVNEKIVNIVVRAQLERQSSDMPVSELREYDQPHDIHEVVKHHNAPQAILRDLYRPVEEYGPQFRSPFDEIPDLDPCREVRDALKSYITVERVELASHDGARARAEGKARMRESWVGHWEVIQELKKAREERGE